MPVFNPVKLPSIYEAKQKASNLKIAGLQQQKLEADVKKLNEPKIDLVDLDLGDGGSITASRAYAGAFMRTIEGNPDIVNDEAKMMEILREGVDKGHLTKIKFPGVEIVTLTNSETNKQVELPKDSAEKLQALDAKWQTLKTKQEIAKEERAEGRKTEKEETPTPFMKELEAYMKLPPGDKRRPFYEQKLAEKGMTVETRPDGSTIITMGQSSKKREEAELTEFRTMERSADDVIFMSNAILTDVNNDPTLIGTVGGLQRFVDSAGAQLTGMLDKIAPRLNVKKPPSLNPDKYDWKSFSSDAIKSAQIKSRLLQLAYAVARVQEPNARAFTDDDIQRAITEIGGGTGSPQQMAGVMRNIQLDAVNALERRSKAFYNKSYLPEGMDEDTISYGMQKGLSREEIILKHIIKYGK